MALLRFPTLGIIPSPYGKQGPTRRDKIEALLIAVLGAWAIWYVWLS